MNQGPANWRQIYGQVIEETLRRCGAFQNDAVLQRLKATWIRKLEEQIIALRNDAAQRGQQASTKEGDAAAGAAGAIGAASATRATAPKSESSIGSVLNGGRVKTQPQTLAESNDGAPSSTSRWTDGLKTEPPEPHVSSAKVDSEPHPQAASTSSWGSYQSLWADLKKPANTAKAPGGAAPTPTVSGTTADHVEGTADSNSILQNHVNLGLAAASADADRDADADADGHGKGDGGLALGPSRAPEVSSPGTVVEPSTSQTHAELVANQGREGEAAGSDAASDDGWGEWNEAEEGGGGADAAAKSEAASKTEAAAAVGCTKKEANKAFGGHGAQEGQEDLTKVDLCDGQAEANESAVMSAGRPQNATPLNHSGGVVGGGGDDFGNTVRTQYGRSDFGGEGVNEEDPDEVSDGLDNVPDLEDPEDPEAVNFIVAIAESVTRPPGRKAQSQGLWRIKANNGVARINGNEFFFKDLHADLEF